MKNNIHKKEYVITKAEYDKLIEAYNKCQEDMTEKKYTEEDIRKAIREGRNSIHFENDGSWWEDETVEEDFIKSLNKPIVIPTTDPSDREKMRCI